MPQRAIMTVAMFLSTLPGLEVTFKHFLRGYCEFTGYECSNQEKHQKTQKIAVFAENLCCLRS